MGKLRELLRIEELTKTNDPLVETLHLDVVQTEKHHMPIIGFKIGSDDPTLPTLGLFGGIHGLEKVGTQVVISYLSTVINRLSWDQDFRKLFEKCRLVSIPLINPVGMATHRRANPNGVDLMRNAPVQSNEASHFLVSGHRISSKLPWYRGSLNAPMEKEAQTLCDFVQKEVFPSQCSLTVDFHSGFGMKDRFWYPYAKSKIPFSRIHEVQRISHLLDKTFPHHIYHIEPQSLSYTTHGDLWDYLFDAHSEINRRENCEKIFIPFTLEMGSWMWLKKNPSQIFNSLGLFNPIKTHRYERIMRRHLLLINFLFDATRNYPSWA